MSGFKKTKRFFLKLEFDGKNFCGWQLQSETVDQEAKHSLQYFVESAIATMLGRNGERHIVQGCGRTDAGVHALEYYCHFDVHKELESKVSDLEKFRHSLNGILPENISVIDLFEVPLDFHAVASVEKKVYEYTLFIRPQKPTIGSDYYHWIAASVQSDTKMKRNFSLENLEAVAKEFVGEHEFKTFASRGAPLTNTTRRIYKIEIIKTPHPHTYSNGLLLKIRFCGSGFLKQMVRNMVGYLVEAGFQKYRAHDLRKLLSNANASRGDAGLCVPANGLKLIKVIYQNVSADLPNYLFEDGGVDLEPTRLVLK